MSELPTSYTDRWNTASEYPGEEIKKGKAEGFRITSLKYGNGMWALTMKKGTKITEQTYTTEYAQMPEAKIKELWDKGYHISDLGCGIFSNRNLWSVVMSQGLGWTGQTYNNPVKGFPADFIKKNWDENHHISSLAYGEGGWRVVMSKGTGFTAQSYWTNSAYPTKEIDKLWEQQYRITALEYGDGLWVLVGSKGTGFDGTGQAVRTNAKFPSDEINKLWAGDTK
jgi:hypothetical protein